MSAESDAFNDPSGAFASIATWQAELSGLDPRSHDYQVLAQVVTELAFEAGVVLPSFAVGLVAAEVPPAFVSATPLDEALEVPADQFRLVPPLYGRGTYELYGTELITDDDRRVRLVDLRPKLTARLDDVAPSPGEATRLDSHFYHDLRLLVERGVARNIVRRNGGGGAGPCYTRVVGMKSRSFWSPVRVVERQGEHVLTVARLADCGADASKEVTLYRRLFGITMRGIK
jgi:hypothetical protein